ncbi:Polyketide synthase OS=Streptomyces fumanus OX=67302 GN=GCM10018772_36640 PE=4 SV=1 [Streptomyces fumanus]
MARGGVIGLSEQEGAALFDTALGLPQPVLLPMRLDFGALRAQAATGPVPPLLRGLVRPPRRTAGTAADAGAFAQRLGRATAEEQEQLLLGLVREEAARVLGHATAHAIGPDLPSTNWASTPSRRSNCATGSPTTPGSGCRPPSSSTIRPPSPSYVTCAWPSAWTTSPAPAAPDSEKDLRRVLATTPLSRLRELGVLDALMTLTEEGEADAAESPAREQEQETAIADMGVDDLVQRAMSKAGK